MGRPSMLGGGLHLQLRPRATEAKQVHLDMGKRVGGLAEGRHIIHHAHRRAGCRVG